MKRPADGWRWWLHNYGNGPNWTLKKWWRWYILCFVDFTTIKKFLKRTFHQKLIPILYHSLLSSFYSMIFSSLKKKLTLFSRSSTLELWILSFLPFPRRPLPDTRVPQSSRKHRREKHILDLSASTRLPLFKPSCKSQRSQALWPVRWPAGMLALHLCPQIPEPEK